MHCLKRLGAAQNGPSDPGQFVGQGNHRDIAVHAGQQGANPSTEGCWLGRQGADDGAGTMDHQAAQIAVAAFADTEQPGFAAGGVLVRYDAEPGCEIPPTLESAAVVDGGNESACDHGADAGDRLQAPTGRIGLRGLLDLLGQSLNPAIELTPLLAQLGQ